MSMNIVRQFSNAIYSQDFLYNIGHPGGPELACVNVQIINQGFNINVIIQPKSGHSTVNEAQFIIPVLQYQIFDKLKIDICLNCEVYSYIEFKGHFNGTDNEIDICKVNFRNEKKRSDHFVDSWPVELKPLLEIPDFLK